MVCMCVHVHVCVHVYRGEGRVGVVVKKGIRKDTWHLKITLIKVSSTSDEHVTYTYIM